ncbi:MAG: hypothetical protein C4336_07135 [Armatimonadota bacterium]
MQTNQNRLKPIAYGIAFDVSQSMGEKERQRCIGVTNQLIDSVNAESIRVKVWRYAENLREVADKMPQRSGELLPIYQEKVLKAMGAWGTHPALPMKEMLRYVQDPTNKDRQVVLWLMTDGEDHSPRETRKLAEELAQQPGLVVLMVGPLKEQYRLQIQRTLEPLEKNQKLIVFSENDAGDALRKLKTHLK